MPEDSKKNQHKAKHEAKEQRKPRQQRHHAAEKSEKKIEKKVEEPKVSVPPKPVYEDPGPEFYKGLKRETEEILKITEEANAKYKKKEIQSNWTKYEMPIESYEEMEEQENLGADYEKLIQAPMSVGGHFQFKHEKTWDVNTAPSLYDKYFEINMETLGTAISTIPFYERNNIDLTLFSETDITTMNNRAIKYKRKYYNDKSYKTPEFEAQDAIINKITEHDAENSDRKTYISESEDIVIEASKQTSTDINSVNKYDDINLESDNVDQSTKNIDKGFVSAENMLKSNENIPATAKEESLASKEIKSMDKPKEIVTKESEIDDIDELIKSNKKTDDDSVNTKDEDIKTKIEDIPPKATSATVKVNESTVKETKQPVIESPEDLEKWLDDFLDG